MISLLAPWEQVRYWLDFVGLSHHKYKFGASAIDGRTLLRLTDESLRMDVGIHAIGQRHQILECIEVRRSDCAGRLSHRALLGVIVPNPGEPLTGSEGGDRL